MTTLTIHYQSPASDPLKVPRPHHVDTETGAASGGEVGPVMALLGFSRTVDPTFTMGDWLGSKIACDQPDAVRGVTRGWYACFATPYGEMFTDLDKVERIEVAK